MDTIQQQALLLEALSDKVLHQLPAAVWKQLFIGPGRDSIRFEQRHLTLVHAERRQPVGHGGADTDAFFRELQRLNTQHGGRLDPYSDVAALVTFGDSAAAIRMAAQLQQAVRHGALRIGVVSGACTLAFFRAQGRLWCTPLGDEPARAAQVASTAEEGGIVISPEAWEGSEVRVREHFEGQPDFRDSELDLSSLAHDIAVDGVDIRC